MAMKLASAGEEIKFWNSVGFNLELEHCPHQGVTSDISWSNDGLYLASLSSSENRITQALVKKSAAVVLNLLPEENQTCLRHANTTLHYLVTGGENGKVHIWDLKSHKIKKTFLGHTQPVTCVTFSGNDSHIASSSVSGEILLHNVQTGTTAKALHRKGTQAIRCLRYNSRRPMLGSVSENGALSLWDCNTHRLIYSFSDTHVAPATGLVFSPINDALVCTVGLDKRIVCYDNKQKQVMKTINTDSCLTCVDMFNNGQGVVVGTSRGKLMHFDLRSALRPVRTWQAHNTSVQRVMFQPLIQNKFASNSGVKPKQEKVIIDPSPAPVVKQTNAEQSPASTTANGSSIYGQSPTVGSSVSRSSAANDNSFMTIFSPLNGGISSSASESNVDTPPNLMKTAASDHNSFLDVFSPFQEGLSPDSADGSAEDIVFRNNIDISTCMGDSNYEVPKLPFKKPIDVPPFPCVDESSYETSYPSPIPAHMAAISHLNRQKKSVTRQVRRSSADGGSITCYLTRRSPVGDSLDHVNFNVSPLALNDSYQSSPSTAVTSTVRQEASPISEKSTLVGYTSAAPSSTSEHKELGSTVAETPPSAGGCSADNNNVTAVASPPVVEHQNGAVAAYNIDFFRNIVREEVDELRDDFRQCNNDLRVDILRDMLILQKELTDRIQNLSQDFMDVLEENRRLREENERLRIHY